MREHGMTRVMAMTLAAMLPLGACGRDEPAAPVGTTVAAAADSAPAARGGSGDHHASGGEHAHEAPHGGVMVAAGDFHLEAVATKMGLVLYLYDAKEKPLSNEAVKAVSGEVTVSAGEAAPVTAPVSPMGNHLMTDVAVDGAWSAVANLTIGGKRVAARFEHEPGGAHAHDHGAHALPGMELSRAIVATVSAPPVLSADEPIELTFAYHTARDGAVVGDLEVTHERRLHVFIVSEDMTFYDHVHPEPGHAEADGKDGVWALRQRLPSPGKYRIYSDFLSKQHGPHVVVSDLVVPGEAPAKRPLVIEAPGEKRYGELAIELAPSPLPIKAKAVTTLTYRVSDAAGAPVRDLEPYLGAMGHLFVLGEDLETIAHSHPEGMERGPTVSFMVVFPKAGAYKLWAQFQRGGEIVTTDWVVAVE